MSDNPDLSLADNIIRIKQSLERDYIARASRREEWVCLRYLAIDTDLASAVVVQLEELATSRLELAHAKKLGDHLLAQIGLLNAELNAVRSSTPRAIEVTARSGMNLRCDALAGLL
jgi:hypothetical protein